MERQGFRGEREGNPLKRIAPDRAILHAWAHSLPPGKDQLFFPAGFPRDAVHGLRPEKITPGKNRPNWGLTERSWFGYLANRATFRIVLPRRKLESLPAAQRLALKKIQRQMKNPAVVPSHFLPANLREPDSHTWLTAGFFRSLAPNERISALKAWDRAGKFTGLYPRTSLTTLPAEPKRILRQRGLLKLVNTFAPLSGPNCFAAVAFALTGKQLGRWMHPEPFTKIIGKMGYRLAGKNPLPGDILICRKGKQAMHAAFYIGGLVFEKPGQDFYEPYRIVSWKKWRNDWRHTKFEIWRN